VYSPGKLKKFFYLLNKLKFQYAKDSIFEDTGEYEDLLRDGLAYGPVSPKVHFEVIESRKKRIKKLVRLVRFSCVCNIHSIDSPLKLTCQRSYEENIRFIGWIAGA
jgi:hypothetical protein